MSIITGAMVSSAPSRMARKKQLWRPVWQATPFWSTRTSSVSPSQSIRRSTRVWMWPDVSPLRHGALRERDQ